MTDAGTRLADRYVLQDRIGAGSMGEVWRATDVVLNRPVAVKLMRSELVSQPGFPERFLTEARIMATIRHPGVVAVHDYHSDAERAFLVMEYVDGESLSRRLHRVGPLAPELAMQLLAQAADALHAAHAEGVVHRDIKPGNLLVTPDDRVVLTDFGIARSATSPSLTMTGALLGTPSYLSPEQVLGEKATYLSDVYALGVVAYECLTGRKPFEGDNPFEVATKRLREPCPPLPPEIPAPVAAVVTRALAVDPQQRWRSAAELAAVARRALTGASPDLPLGSLADAGAAGVGAGDVSDGVTARIPLPSPTSTPTFSRGRTPVPQPATLVEHSPLPAARSGTTASRSSPAAPSASLPPPPPTPPRPLPVLIGSSLLALGGLSMLIYSVSSLSVLSQLSQLAEQRYPKEYRGWGETAILTGLLGSGVLALLAITLVALAAFTFHGRRSARTWSYLLALPILCCCGPCWWGTSADQSVDSESAGELAQALVTAVPTWYPELASRTLWITALSFLAALVLLMLPPANRFFARRPIIYYYPYYPPYQPHR